ncbi:MAG: hypothetical protein AB7T49_10445 [Oligoflexales bacterium]
MKNVWIKIGLPWLILLLLAGCSRSAFTTKEKSKPSPEQVDEDVTKSGSDSEEIVEEEEQESIEKCAVAVGNENQDVVSVSQGDIDASEIAEGSVLLVRIQGQADINIASSEFPELSGVCLDARGEADANIVIDGNLDTLFYLGRGNADVTVDFQEAGNLANAEWDVSGSSTLSLLGAQLDCDTLTVEKSGSSQVECNGS